MKHDLNNEYNDEDSKKTKTRRRTGKKIEENDSEEENPKKNSQKQNKFSENQNYQNSKTQKILSVNNNNSKKTSELQNKLKKIFAVREMGKYEYNKQEIPEYLKYHSDDSDSSEISGLKKSIISKKEDLQQNNNDVNINNTSRNMPSVKRQTSDKSSDRLSIKNNKMRKSKETDNDTTSSKNKNKNSNKNSNTNSFKNSYKKSNTSSNKNSNSKKYNEENNNTDTKSKKSKKINNNNDEIKKNDEKEIENIPPKKNNIRDLIAKLKAKKNEKEDLERQEKEAEEQSIMRGKIERKKEEEIDESEIEREAEKLRQKEKRMEERRIAREKRRKQEEEDRRKKLEKEENERKKKEEEEKRKKEEEKRKKEEERQKKEEEEKRKIEEEKRKKEEEKKIEEERKKEIKINRQKGNSRSKKKYNYNEKTDINNPVLPSKIYRDEENEQNKNIIINNKINHNEKCRRRASKNEQSDSNNKNINNQQNENQKTQIKKKEIILNSEIPTNKLDRSFDAVNNAYKKPIQKYSFSGKGIYKPKRATGVIRGRSQEKATGNILPKINDSNGGSSNNSPILNNKKINQSGVAYKKRSVMGGNFCQLNKSFGEYRNTNMDNGLNFMNGKYNINTLELSSLPELNSSFDSRLINMGNNFQFGFANDFYARTAQKDFNGNKNTINSPIISNNNRYNNMSNFFGVNNLNNLNTLSYMNGDNENYFNISNPNINNNSSFYDMRQAQLSPYELNSSYNFGYNNPIANFPPNTPVGVAMSQNMLNNNYFGMNNSFQRRVQNYNANNNGNFVNLFNKFNSSSINIEDLLILEEKLSEITTSLNKVKIMYNECFEFWNYYYNCSLYGSLEKLFTNVLDSNNILICINYILMSVLICYDCSFDIDVLNNVYSVLKELLNLSHKNLMLIYEHILSKISNDSIENVWVIKLLNIVNSSKNTDMNDYNTMNGYSMTLIEKINFNTGIIIQNIRVLLKNYKTPRVEYLTSLFKKINEKTCDEINSFFRQYILRMDHYNGSILTTVFLKENPDFKTEPAPYLRTKNQKNYSLVLGLDETLVHFKMNPGNEGEGVLKVRPGVMEFLDAVDKFYELIIFTTTAQDYANILIDSIEENKIYFEHRLYRQHAIIKDNDFCKDLSRIGRPLEKIIIVDNMPQNFRLQKENGICIKSFWGEDIYDTALIDLIPILINIAKEGGDVRKGLKKYRDEIIEKVTSNLSKHNI